ncbi:MAG: MMPL family transporter [Chloroflexia bacterium]|nr:MMPL family transporter [Chloroflexia bacterium]
MARANGDGAQAPSTDPFERWARLVFRRKLAFLLLPVLVTLAMLPLAGGVTERLSASGWLPAGAPSHEVERVLKQEFGRHGANHYLLFRDPTGQLHATAPEFRREVARAVAPLRADPNVAAMYTYGSTSSEALNAKLISADGSASLVVITLRVGVVAATTSFPEFHSKVHSDRLDVRVGGWPAISDAFREVTLTDLGRAELISLPLALILLLVVFGGLIAASLPLLIGILTIGATLASISLISRFMETSIFAVNIATMIGFALAVDYSLFLVARFREELRSHDVETALARSLATSGRAVLYSGLTVAIGIAGLAIFGSPAMISMGIAGLLVVALGLAYSFTALTAAIAMLGPRINAARVLPTGIGIGRRGRFWSGLASRVMAHPARFVLPVLVALILAGLPFLHYRGAAPTMDMLPADREARGVYDTVLADFPDATLSPLTVVVRPRRGAMTSAANLQDLATFSDEVARLPGVRNVETIWNYVPSGVGAYGLSGTLLLDETLRREATRFLTADAAVIEVALERSDTDPASLDLVQTLRERGYELSRGAFDVEVGGGAAVNLDLADNVVSRAPWAVLAVLIVTFLVLFAQLGSILLPLKAIVLNLLSLTASYGALVWIFQDGHLTALLGFEPLGYTVLMVPVMMFCFMFGLSMDYEVLMLSRIKEEYERHGDNTSAVTSGLQATGSVVTSAALIMFVVFAAFGTGQLLMIQALGVGLAIAVAIDATLIRAILVPAMMRLLGDRNWWAPSWARRNRRDGQERVFPVNSHPASVAATRPRSE